MSISESFVDLTLGVWLTVAGTLSGEATGVVDFLTLGLTLLMSVGLLARMYCLDLVACFVLDGCLVLSGRLGLRGSLVLIGTLMGVLMGGLRTTGTVFDSV